MSIGFPTHTVILIVATMIASASAAWFLVSQGLRRISLAPPGLRAWRWGAALVLAAGLLLRLALAAYPPAGPALATQFTITFGFLGAVMLAGILPLLVSPRFRQLLRSIPASWPVGVHAVRLAGFLFLALLDMRLLPAEFALSAGYGDMAVGLLALGLVFLLARGTPGVRPLLVVWNGLGLLDFAAALVTGGLYLPPFAARLAAAGVSLDYLNYVLVIPAFGVPLYALLHLYSLYQIAARRREEAMRTPAFRGEQRSAGA
jgi:hypothetical protein